MTSVTFASRKRKHPTTVSYAADFDPFAHSLKFMSTIPWMREYVLRKFSPMPSTLNNLILCMNSFVAHKKISPQFKGAEAYSTEKLEGFVKEMKIYAQKNKCGEMVIQTGLVQEEQVDRSELAKKLKIKSSGKNDGKRDEETFAGSLFKGTSIAEVSSVQHQTEKTGSEQLEAALWAELQAALDKWDEVE